MIKIVSSTHHRDGETEPRDAYTKKDPVVCAAPAPACGHGTLTSILDLHHHRG